MRPQHSPSSLQPANPHPSDSGSSLEPTSRGQTYAKFKKITRTQPSRARTRQSAALSGLVRTAPRMSQLPWEQKRNNSRYYQARTGPASPKTHPVLERPPLEGAAADGNRLGARRDVLLPAMYPFSQPGANCLTLALDRRRRLSSHMRWHARNRRDRPRIVELFLHWQLVAASRMSPSRPQVSGGKRSR